ncbi:MAG: hypothetical protein CMQ15_17260 [Gammaproteobacteria bacterium]|nr:hypothetical protein [Gammaproteobacteria bacterium]
MSRNPQNSIKLFLFAIFALSGFCGLIYESIWTHFTQKYLLSIQSRSQKPHSIGPLAIQRVQKHMNYQPDA